MSFGEFHASIARDALPAQKLGGALAGLWHDARGDWDAAHQSCQEDAGRAGAWVHAYLHRKEGDAGNAAYWYARAGRPVPAKAVTLAAEWEQIARELLEET